MQAIRSKNTKPEILLRRLLHARGFRFRLHVKDLPGTPDIVLPKYRAAILVHGCFWHGHDCYLFKLPQQRREFWQEKIEANRTRDIRNRQELKNAGWRVLVIWECALKGRLRQPVDTLVSEVDMWIRDAAESNGSAYMELRCLPAPAA